MCCGQIFRCAMQIIMIATLVIGITVIAVGSALTVYLENYGNDLINIAGSNIDGDLYLAAVYMMLPVGTLLFIAAIFGCLGTRRQGCKLFCCVDGSLCLLVFIVSTAVIAILVITSGILATVYKNSLDDTGLSTDFQNQVKREYNATGKEDLTRNWDVMQAYLECCGAIGITDYEDSVFSNTTTYAVPQSCCVEYDIGDKSISSGDYSDCLTAATSTPVDAEFVHTDACSERYGDKVVAESDIVSGVCYALGLVNLIGIFVACCIRDRLED